MHAAPKGAGVHPDAAIHYAYRSDASLEFYCGPGCT